MDNALSFLDTRQPSINEEGEVVLVGAGPGDPDLLTIKALRALGAADIVYYDALVSEEILALIPDHAVQVYVGKRKANHSLPQTDIVRVMIKSAQQGKKVIRLKGGDPFVFGRGGEEVEGVKAAGIPVSVVPGISSALGCAASAGIPLTHRDHAQAVTFITGHQKAEGEEVNWAAYSDRAQTLVIFMGVGTAASTSKGLIKAGRAASTPVAIVEKGTLADEKIVRGSLENLGSLIAKNEIKGPALLIIGDVAKLAELPAKILEVAAA